MSLMRKFNAPVASNDDGRRLFSKPPSKAYSDGWDAVFGNRDACRECKARLLYEGEVLCDECAGLTGPA